MVSSTQMMSVNPFPCSLPLAVIIVSDGLMYWDVGIGAQGWNEKPEESGNADGNEEDSQRRC